MSGSARNPALLRLSELLKKQMIRDIRADFNAWISECIHFFQRDKCKTGAYFTGSTALDDAGVSEEIIGCTSPLKKSSNWVGRISMT